MKKLAAEKSAAGDYAQSIGEEFDTYRSLREQGYSKEEAARKSLGKTSLAILSTKADDYIGKNNKVDDVLYGKSGIVDKVDDILPDVPKKSTITEKIEKGEISTKINKWKQNIQIYYFEGQKIGVYNNECIDAVYVCSDIELEEILGIKSIY